MGTNKKPLNVPNLRFSEFKDEWKANTLDNLVESLSTNSLSWDFLNIVEGEVKNIHYGLIHKGFETTIISSDNNHIAYINESIDTTKMNFIKSGDLVMVDTSEDKKDVAKSIEIKLENDDKLVSGLHTFLLRDSTNEFTFGFKSYHLKCKSSQIQLNRISTGTKVYSINKSNLKEITINYPTKDEQFKIVDLLNKIENKIQLQMKIIEEYKKLNNIINKKIIKEMDVYEKSKISSICECFNEKTLENNQYPVLSSTKNGIFIQTDYFSKVTSSSDTTGYKIVPKNYITYRSMSDTGDFYFNQQILIDKGIVSPAYPVFRSKVLDNYLLSFYLNNSNIIKREIFKDKTGGTRFALPYSKIEDIYIPIPSSDKQGEYVRILSIFQKLLLKNNELLKSFRNIKNYLINNLFI